jgi:hypothetical protein
VGVPTCSLSGRMHAVWSPDGPQDGTPCLPYPAMLSGTGLASQAVSVQSTIRPPRIQFAGVGPGCQLAHPLVGEIPLLVTEARVMWPGLPIRTWSPITSRTVLT